MPARLRSFLFWTHLVIGVCAGVFILNMAVSGMCIAYADPLTDWAESSQRTVTAPAGTARLGMTELVDKVQAAQPDLRFSRITVFAEPTAATLFFLDKPGQVLIVDPYTGSTQGHGASSLRVFFQFMNGWHRWLALEGAGRPVGKAITGAACFAYFLLLLIGLLLWLPRPWSRQNLKRQLKPRLDLQGKARDWNWHNVIGFWASPLLLVVTLTGLIMSYDWANGLLFKLTKSPMPAQRGQKGEGDKNRNATPAPIDTDGLTDLWNTAVAQAPGWSSISLRVTSRSVNFQVTRGNSPDRPDLNSQLTLDRDSGDVTRAQTYADQSTGQKLRSWVKPLHTGAAFGLLGESVAVLAALAGSLLIWTGLSLSWRRFFKRKTTLVLLPSPAPSSSPL